MAIIINPTVLNKTKTYERYKNRNKGSSKVDTKYEKKPNFCFKETFLSKNTHKGKLKYRGVPQIETETDFKSKEAADSKQRTTKERNREKEVKGGHRMQEGRR